MSWYTADNRIWLYVFRHYTPHADDRAIPNNHPRTDLSIKTNPYIIPDPNPLGWRLLMTRNIPTQYVSARQKNRAG